MDPAWVGIVIIVVINIFGWGATWGRLNGRVKNLEMTLNRHEKILGQDGLLEKISDLASRCSTLEGTLKTYIDIKERES